MTVYVVGDARVTDYRWIPEYAAHVHNIVHKHGGRYLSRSSHVSTLEGDPLHTTVMALLQFPSMDAMKAFAADPAYAPFAKSRRAGSISRVCVVDETDFAGTIPYLPKG